MSESTVIQGRWWLPEMPIEEAVQGTLTVSADELRLDLEGSIHGLASEHDPIAALMMEARPPEDVGRILGETSDRKDVTLEGCRVASVRTRGRRRGGTTNSESYWPSIICLGAWFHVDEPLAFDRVFVRLSSLHPWTAVSGFDPMWNVPFVLGEPVAQTYTPPEERTAALSDGTTLRLEFPLVERFDGLYTFRKTFTQATRFVFEYPEPRSMTDVQQHVSTLRNFLTLAVGEAVKVTELVGYREPLPSDELSLGRSAEVVYQHLENPRARELQHHHDMVFLLDDIGDRFEHHLVRWFEHVPDLGRVLDLYFSTFHVEFMYLETRFMNFAQAVEGFHRRRLNRTMYDEATFDTYRNAILEQVSGKPRALARRALKYANEVSLEDRIRDVLRHLGDPGASILAAGSAGTREAATFAKRAAGLRNVYAHNLHDEQPDSRELAVFTFQLRALMEALLLTEVGFDAQVIDTKLREARRYRLISAIAAG